MVCLNVLYDIFIKPFYLLFCEEANVIEVCGISCHKGHPRYNKLAACHFVERHFVYPATCLICCSVYYITIDGLSVYNLFVDKLSVVEMSIDKRPENEVPVNETPVNEISLGDMSADEMSVDKMSLDSPNLKL
jgi:hypothetical protein